MLTGKVWTWEHPGRALLNWDLKPGEKFQRKPLGGVRGRSRVKEATRRRPERLVLMLPPLWLGSAGKCEARSSGKGWRPEHGSGHERLCVSTEAFRFYLECDEAP